MCGIIGYFGERNGTEIVLDGIKKLEYRGYDSAGVAIVNGSGVLVHKDVGKVNQVFSGFDAQKFEGKIAFAHCLHPNSYIQLADGTVCKIEDIMDYKEVMTLDFDTLKLKTRSCYAMRHESPHELFEIKTPANTLVCTGEHRMFVANSGKISVKHVSELSTGDILICPSRITIEGKTQHLSTVPLKRYYKYDKDVVELFKSYLRQNNLTIDKFATIAGLSRSVLDHFCSMDRNFEESFMIKLSQICSIQPERFLVVYSIHGKDIILPETTSEDLLQFLGYLVGDGHVHERCIRFKDSRKDVLKKYAQIAKKLFNVNSRIVKLKEAEAFLLEINSKFLCDWIRYNFPEICKTGRGKALPPLIGRTPDEELRGFIRGLFDAESACNTKSRQIMIRMNNENLIKALKLLLLRFGILSSFSKYERVWGPVYGLNINTADDVEGFLKNIGFTSTEKLQKAERILSKMIKGHSHSYKSIPLTKAEMYQKYAIKGKALYGKAFITKTSALQLLSLMQAKGNIEVSSDLGRYLNSDVVFQKITEIRKFVSDVPYVYDLQVPGTENFVADGLISHNSRWATHGGVTKENAHPHLSNDGKIAVIHNGIVENYQELRNFLQSKGYKFASQTDTETIPLAVQYFMDMGMDFLKAFKETVKTIDGAYAILAVHKDYPMLLAARRDSPLVIGVGEKEYFIASDIPAFLDHTKKVLFFRDNELAIIDKSGVKLENLLTAEVVDRKPDIIDWSPEQAKKGNFDHFTIKEILEQVDTVKRSLLQNRQKVENIAKLIRKAENVVFVACGTASYACRHANYIFAKVAKMNTVTITGSEFMNYADFINEKTLVIAVSQSGETMDTLLPIKAAKERGAETVAIVNVMGSTIMREADHYLMTNAGPEISVVSTKAFTAQVALLTLLAYAVAGKYDDGKEKLQNLIYILYHLTSGAAREHTKKVAELLKDKEHIYLIGRGLQYTTAMEAALKIKEISYIHAEAYPGGELKHGTIALIDKGTPCIVFVSEDTEKDIISNATELKARGAIIIGVGPKNNEVFDHWIRVWDAGVFNSICQIIPMQVLAYHLAIMRGCNPDFPRNLAKSVTVK